MKRLLQLRSNLIIYAALFLSCLGNIASAAEIEYLSSPANKTLNLPFSEAVRVDDTLYMSGQVGNVPGKFELIPGGIGPETKQTLENVGSITSVRQVVIPTPIANRFN